MNIDNLLKTLAEHYPGDFATWLLGRPVEALEPIERLKTELGGESIRADFVAFLHGAGEILHIEFLFSRPRRDETPSALRMLDYWVRLYRQYRVDVVQVLVLVTPRSGSDPGVFERQGTRHRYRVVKLWEEDPAAFLAHEGLLPLAVLARTADRRALLSAVAEEVGRIEPPERRRDIASAASLLAGLVMDWKEVRTMFEDKDWLKESSTYQHILHEGMEEGRAAGRAEGRAEGRVEGRVEGRSEGARLLLLGVLESRFGAVPPELRTRLGHCSADVLQQLAPVAATCGSVEDFAEVAGRLAPQDSTEQQHG